MDISGKGVAKVPKGDRLIGMTDNYHIDTAKRKLFNHKHQSIKAILMSNVDDDELFIKHAVDISVLWQIEKRETITEEDIAFADDVLQQLNRRFSGKSVANATSHARVKL